MDENIDRKDIPRAYKCTVVFEREYNRNSNHQWTKLVVGEEYMNTFRKEYLVDKKNVSAVLISYVGTATKDMVENNDTYREKNVLDEFFQER